jgi:hypothetical protein
VQLPRASRARRSSRSRATAVARSGASTRYPRGDTSCTVDLVGAKRATVACPLLPACTGIDRVLLLLVERFRRGDRAEAAPSPGGHGGTWDLNVLGNGHGATTNDVFAKAMVVGAPCLRCVPDAGSWGRTTLAIALCQRPFDKWAFLLAPRYI